jgi:HAD superfamily hydrolase (TIGR01509 family)
MPSRARGSATQPMNTAPPALKAVIFDVDGTLADTEPDGHRPAFNAAFREYGLDWEWDVPLYGELLAVTGGKERIRSYCAKHRPEFLDRPDADALIAELHQAKTRHYVAFMERGEIPPRPGVVRLIRNLRDAGIRLAIATTTTPANVDALLKYTLHELPANSFEVIGAGDIVPAKKPAPDIYWWVLERLGLSGQDCLAIEDSHNGVLAARGAGLPVLVTESAYTRGQDFSGSAAVLSDLGEPAAPARAIMGAAPENGCVDVAYLARLRDAGRPDAGAP